MSRKYIIKHIRGELLNNFIAKSKKPADILGMEHDYCKTTECSTLIDHYDGCFKRISTVVSYDDAKYLKSNVEDKFENTINVDDKSYQNIEEKILENVDSHNNSFHQSELNQMEVDNAYQSIITNLHDSYTRINLKPRRIPTQSIILRTNKDSESNKDIEELQLLLRQDNSTSEFVPNQVVQYETYEEAVHKNDGKTTKMKCFKNCKYEEGLIHITREEIQTYNKCKKHILLKDFLKLLIWKKFPSVNNVCNFNISTVNSAYTIYAYCNFLSCNNFRIVIRQKSDSLIGFVYKSRLEPLHYENIPLFEQVRGIKRKLLGSSSTSRNRHKDPFCELTEKILKKENICFAKNQIKKKYKEHQFEDEIQVKEVQQLEKDVDEEEIQCTDEEIVNSTEVQLEEEVYDEEQMEEIINSTEVHLEEEVYEKERMDKSLNSTEVQLEEEVYNEEQMEEIINSTEVQWEEEIDNEEQMRKINEEILYSTEVII